MKAATIASKLLVPSQLLIFSLLTLFSYNARAEYYLAYGGEPAMVELYGYAHHHVMGHHHYHHHYGWARWHRHNWNQVEVYYFLRPDCCGAYYAPVVPSYYYPPVAPYGYVPISQPMGGDVVFQAQPDLYSGSQVNEEARTFNPDMRTGDDVGNGMDIDY